MSISTKLAAIICAAVLSCGLLAGCAGQGNTATQEQKDNRAYMSQVNELMVELDEGLDSFVAAVSRNDIVNMRLQAENAFGPIRRRPEGSKEESPMVRCQGGDEGNF